MILALDNATRHCGFALFDDNNTLIEQGLLISKNEDVIERMLDVSKQVEDLLLEYPSAKLVFENPVYMQFNIDTFRKLNMLSGMLIFVARKWDRKYAMYAPKTWRKILGFKTNQLTKQQKKTLAIDFVKDKFGIDLDSDDIAEAICIGWADIIKE